VILVISLILGGCQDCYPTQAPYDPGATQLVQTVRRLPIVVLHDTLIKRADRWGALTVRHKVKTLLRFSMWMGDECEKQKI
jgi:hypothetical protein